MRHPPPVTVLETHLMALMDNTQALIGSIDRNYILLTANKAFLQSYRHFGVELTLGVNLLAVSPPEVAQKWKQCGDQAFLGQPVVTEFICTDIIFEVTLTPLVTAGEIESLAIFAQNITLQRQAEQHLQQRVQYLATLNRITQALVKTPDLAVALKAAAAEIGQLLPAKACSLNLLNHERTALVILAYFSRQTQLDTTGWVLRLSDNPADAHVVATGQSEVIFQDSTGLLSAQSYEYMRQEDIHCMLIVPLQTRGQVIGTISVSSLPNQAFNAGEINLVETIAGQVAGMIENIQLYQEMQREKNLLETISYLNPIATLIINPQYQIMAWNPAAERLFGYMAEEALGQNFLDLITTAELRTEADMFAQKVLAGQKIQVFSRRRRRDDTLLDVELFAVPITLSDNQTAILALYHDITELLRARHEAETANQAKSEFLASMSHEIRTPLNAIVGMTSLLLYTRLTPEQIEFVQIALNSSNTLLALINDILDFSKIEANKLELEQQPFNLYKCVEEAIDLLASAATDKNLELVYTIDRQTPAYILGDVTRLRQILVNLLSNAVKFTARGEVVVSVMSSLPARRNVPGEIHFSVKDTGVGIPSDRLHRLFQSFSQVDVSTTRKYGGTGLGLNISKRLSELMGGKMWVESRAGVGSTFHFTILATPVDEPSPAYIQTNQPAFMGKRILIVDDNATNRRILMRQTRSWGMVPTVLTSGAEALDWIRDGEVFHVGIVDMYMPTMDGVELARAIQQYTTSLPLILMSSFGKSRDIPAHYFQTILTKPTKIADLHQAIAQALTPEMAAPTMTIKQAPVISQDLSPNYPLRILLVEDNLINQKVALQMLKRLGYTADVVGDGQEAIDYATKQLYDVILMDIQMPHLDGVEATQRIRQLLLPYQQPTIIALTANAITGDRENYLEAGMDDYLSKPLTLESLGKALKMVKKLTIDAPTHPPFELDLSQLNAMVDSDVETIHSISRQFLAEVPYQITVLRQAIEQQDAKALRLNAHSLKSNAALFKATLMVDLCQQLELKAKEEQFGGAMALVKQLETAFGEVQTVLQKELLEK